MKITFVKKILANGQPCRKCADIEKRLLDSGKMSMITEVLIADERDDNSAGMKLAKKLKVVYAPFFVIDDGDRKTEIYTVYFKFAKEVLGRQVSKLDQSTEILNDNPDLDFI